MALFVCWLVCVSVAMELTAVRAGGVARLTRAGVGYLLRFPPMENACTAP